MMQYFPCATWSTALKVSSCLGFALIIGVGIGAVNAIPHGTQVPYAEAVGTLVAFVPPAILLFSLLFIVRGYKLKPHELWIRRLLSTTRISLNGLQQIQVSPTLMKCSIKVVGNGGLFAITGLYQNKLLGRYRAFVTNPAHTIALFLPDRIIVISPKDTDAFIKAVLLQFPHLNVEFLNSHSAHHD